MDLKPLPFLRGFSCSRKRENECCFLPQGPGNLRLGLRLLISYSGLNMIVPSSKNFVPGLPSFLLYYPTLGGSFIPLGMLEVGI